MLLSIIIPTYNSEATIEKAINSIVDQTFTNWEILIMDGASQDRTVQIAQGYNDNRIRVYSESDCGIYDAMNKGIVKAKGEWLYFLGSDDYLVGKSVFESVFAGGTNDIDILYGDVESHLPVDNTGEWSIDKCGANRCHQGIFYSRRFFKEKGLYDLKYRLLADYDANLKWLFDKRIKKQYRPVVVAHFSEGGASCRGNDALFERDFPWLVLRRGYSQLSMNQKITYAGVSFRRSAGMPFRWAVSGLLMMVLKAYNKVFVKIK